MHEPDLPQNPQDSIIDPSDTAPSPANAPINDAPDPSSQDEPGTPTRSEISPDVDLTPTQAPTAMSSLEEPGQELHVSVSIENMGQADSGTDGAHDVHDVNDALPASEVSVNAPDKPDYGTADTGAAHTPPSPSSDTAAEDIVSHEADTSVSDRPLSSPISGSAAIPPSAPHISESAAIPPSATATTPATAMRNRVAARRQRPPRQVGKRLRDALPITAIIVIAALLRIFGYDWDEGTALHPDERAIRDHLATLGLPHSWAEFWSSQSPLNPHFSAYGHLPFYATVLFGHFLSFIGHHVGDPLAGLVNADVGNGIIESGRVLSGLADTGTLIFMYLIGRMLYSRGVGVLAALLGCFTVLRLEFSHMAAVDTYLGFCVTGALYFCVRIVRYGRVRDYVWSGIWIGFAISCKISGLPLVVPLIVAHVYRGAQGASLSLLGATPSPLAQRRGRPSNPLLLAMTVLITLVTVFVTMPYAFINDNWGFNNMINPEWWNDVWYQLQLAQGIQEQAFTRKFSGLPAYWYPLQQMLGWSLGLPLGLAAVAGLIATLVRQIRRRRGSEVVLLAWALVFFAATGGQYMKFLRYMLPLVPTLTIFAAFLLVSLWQWARSRPLGVIVRLGIAVVVLLNTLYGLAYENIYTAENTRLAATRWMAANIPAQSIITTEDWDETLPWAPPGLNVPSYNAMNLAILGPGDNPSTTVTQYINVTQQAQYVTIASARDYGSVAHQPGRYPYSIRWYDLLFSGKLNFKLVEAFANHPHLGPFVLNDYQAPPNATYYDKTHFWYEADQNMSEYDHPPVFIFKRTGPINPDTVRALLTDNGKLLPQVAAYDPTHPMLLSPKVAAADAKAPTYDQVFPPDSLPAKVPMLFWLLMIEVLGLLALPLVMRACAGLRDGGYGLAKIVGIVGVGYAVWLAASLHVAMYSRGLILGACLGLLVLSLLFGLRPVALWQEIKRRRGGILWAEGIFLAAFVVMTLLRMAYPDLWHMTYGGERTQEVSFTNAILRSQYFPPLDPWFAGGTLNYYYYGQYLTGMLMKLIGISVPVGFNLALPTLYALVLSITFSIGYNATGRKWIGVVALALEGVLGNLGPMQQFAALAPTKAPPSLIPLISGLRDMVSGLFAVLTHQNGLQIPSDFFWTSSRILSISNGDAINEFPIWSFTYGDMHAHVIDMPILLAVIGLALAISGLGSADMQEGGRLPLSRLLLLGGIIAVVAGATGPTNLWDLPTSVIVVVVGFSLRGWIVARRRGWELIIRDMAVPGAVLGLLCLMLYRPFYSSVLGISSGFTFLQPHTPTDEYLLHLGLPLFLIISFLIVFLGRDARLFHHLGRVFTVMEFGAFHNERAERLPHYYRVAEIIVRQSKRWRYNRPPVLLSAHALILGAVLAILCWWMAWTTLAVITVILTLAVIALIEACTRELDPQQSQPFALALAVMGLTLTAIPDLVMQNEAGRMNTFFKLYNQAWPMLAIAAALALSALVRSRPKVAPQMAQQDTRLPSRVPAIAQTAVASSMADPAIPRRSILASDEAALASSPGAVALATHRPPDNGEPPTGNLSGDLWMPSTLENAMPGDDNMIAAGPVVALDMAGQNGTTSYDPSGMGTPDETLPVSAGGATNGENAPIPGSFPGNVSDVSGEPERPSTPVAPVPALAPTASLIRQRDRQAREQRGPGWAGDLRFLWWIALGILTFGGTLFPIFGTYTHLQLRSGWNQTASASIPTGLDGAAFVRVLYPGDWAAIQWINGHISGTPVLLTSDRGGYRNFGAKVTMFTGLPTISSWPGEDQQERYGGQGRPASQFPSAWINQLDSGRVTWDARKGQWVNNLPAFGDTPPGSRATDVEIIYNTPAPEQALALLHEYHVQYIYVGTAERGDPNSDESQNPAYGNKAGFDPAGLAKFDQLAAAGQLKVIYNQQGVTIYRVVA